jgi:hypothetical protein
VRLVDELSEESLARSLAGDQSGRTTGNAHANNAEQNEDCGGSQGYSLKESAEQLAQIHEWIMGARAAVRDITKGQQQCDIGVFVWLLLRALAQQYRNSRKCIAPGSIASERTREDGRIRRDWLRLESGLNTHSQYGTGESWRK